MRSPLPLAVAAVLALASTGRAYVEAPYSLGQMCKESTNIVLVEVAQVNAQKGLVIYKKLRDLKGTQPDAPIKHNIGTRGFHEREWKTVMSWAAPGKRAVFFHNGGASETCIGDYWYQCYKEGEWWGMSHAEPYLLRTFCGEADALADAVARLQRGEEVVITCMANANLPQLHQRKGKLQRMRASARRLDYNAKRDFVGWGAGDGQATTTETIVVLNEGSPGWKFLAARQVAGERWREPDFDDGAWQSGKAPLGYGEDEIKKRGGTVLAITGQDVLFRRTLEVPAGLLTRKGVRFYFGVASDNSAALFVNGQPTEPDPQADHEFAYWNHEAELPARYLRPGRNVIAVRVRNTPGSSDLYLDLRVWAEAEVPAKAAASPTPTR